jgi:uncharacterized protein YbcI
MIDRDALKSASTDVAKVHVVEPARKGTQADPGITSETSDSRGRRASVSTVISNGLSKLHRDYCGRGPKSVRTVYGHDHVVSFLEDTYTPVERTLVEAGETEAVENIRRAFQRAMKERFVAVVEDATGRTVRAFMSGVSLEPDISVEIFVLDRTDADGAQDPSASVGQLAGVSSPVPLLSALAVSRDER